MKKLKKWPIRAISLLLIAVMLLSSVPMASFASTQNPDITADITDNLSEQSEEEEINSTNTANEPEEPSDIQNPGASDNSLSEQSEITEESDASENSEDAQNTQNSSEKSESENIQDGNMISPADDNNASDGSSTSDDIIPEPDETVTISVSLSPDTVQDNLVNLNIDNLPSSGFFNLGDTINFSLTLADDQVTIHGISASLNGSSIAVQDNGDGSYSIILPGNEDYSGDPDGRLEITVDAELPSADDTTAHITWSVTPEETATLNISPEKESYDPGDLVTLSLDMIEGYDLSDIQAYFGDELLELNNADPEDHYAVYTLQIPDFLQPLAGLI